MRLRGEFPRENYPGTKTGAATAMATTGGFPVKQETDTGGYPYGSGRNKDVKALTIKRLNSKFGFLRLKENVEDNYSSGR